MADYRSRASSSWVTDIGSSHHVASDLSSFDHSEAYHDHDNLFVGNGKGLPILHIGSSKLYSPNKTFHLLQILHVAEIKQNLLSVQNLCDDNNVYFEFHTSFFAVNDENTHTTLLMVQVVTAFTPSTFRSCSLPRLKLLSPLPVLLPSLGINDLDIPIRSC